MTIYIWVLVGVVILIIVWFVSIYNSLIILRTRTEEAWADIEVQLKRRYDLIPNLVNTVKGYAVHEKEIFENVTEARAQALRAKSKKDTIKAEGELEKTLKTLFAVAENYPNLKASENFKKLQEELSDTEDKIQAARRFYNINVRDFNIRCQTFPSSIVARFFSFRPLELFELEGEEEEKAKKVPKVNF